MPGKRPGVELLIQLERAMRLEPTSEAWEANLQARKRTNWRAFLRFSVLLKRIPIGAAELEAAFLWVPIFGRIAVLTNWRKSKMNTLESALREFYFGSGSLMRCSRSA